MPQRLTVVPGGHADWLQSSLVVAHVSLKMEITRQSDDGEETAKLVQVGELSASDSAESSAPGLHSLSCDSGWEEAVPTRCTMHGHGSACIFGLKLSRGGYLRATRPSDRHQTGPVPTLPAIHQTINGQYQPAAFFRQLHGPSVGADKPPDLILTHAQNRGVAAVLPYLSLSKHQSTLHFYSTCSSVLVPSSLSAVAHSASDLAVLGCALSGLAAAWVVFAAWTRPRRRYPPGPKGLPVLGNIFDVPLENGWLVFRDWAHRYGSDIVHVEALGKHVCVVNSAKAAKDLFDGRPHIYSDKEQSVMAQELSGWDRAWALSPYGDAWREYRRLFHHHFRPMAVPQYHHKQTKAVRRLLHLLLDTPDDFMKHIRYAAGVAILDVTYAIDALPGDPRIELVEAAVNTFGKLVGAGVYLVDIFPILKHVPAWFPGAQFKRDAAEYKKLVDGMYEMPYRQFKAALKEGRAQPCFTGSLLAEAADSTDTPELDEFFTNLTGTAYAGEHKPPPHCSTTVVTLTTFIYAMVLHPEAQVLVQEELDRVVGRDRLPEMADQDALPRVTALIQEVLRCVASPLAVGFVPAFRFGYLLSPDAIDLFLATRHRAVTDDEYNGCHIPAGSVVIGNSWAILHDEETYPDPHRFDPTRFLTTDGPALLRADVPFPAEAFGFGRRTCPGRPFVLDMLFLAVSKRARGVHRGEGRGRARQGCRGRGGVHPAGAQPFKARFRPRFSGAEELVRSAALADL
ncbi:uncharacterized protein PHACADRAFT_209392 [Phanerochaete carnosa HHB-10118-sp]|uniref:Cytochrome P450 n=1 Tax=Phanerochaete carnosa (strain HHB-10118-sp) TaxID=650164 RepID=K5W9L7_PHACS|nr:uncharacterized protein PHACADRAFT_209392 [Phanerochaete carnosa HHB-10118-sp]EKM55880.1 hypothetical protein PHACADRAFT_209392 [Phanerochaete carnosa HHB-10118-sp]